MVKRKLTKSQALIEASTIANLFQVPKMKVFSRREITTHTDTVLREIEGEFSGAVAVRSSASDEDGENLARAGEYDSFLNINPKESSDVEHALYGVLASYDKKGLNKLEEEVFVQAMVQDLCMSGVAFTHDLNTGAPYYVINCDDISGTT